MYLLKTLFDRIIREGDLQVIDHNGVVHQFGTPSDRVPPATFRCTTAARARAIARNLALGAAEGYMDGTMIVERAR